VRHVLTYRTGAPVKIAIDIDSTLHHYWDVLEAVARRRYGVALPYGAQRTWEIPGLAPEQLRAVVEETHRDEHVLAATPYPGAVETVTAWHAAGHFIHVTSRRRAEAHGATERWLRAIGLPYDELHCSYDKIARAREIGIDVLIDDSPVDLIQARDAGMTPATLRHPWNETLCDEEKVLCAPDWPALRTALEPILSGGAKR
jgi:beta-phosphoglucomutase-like phosphatase (HAD superfamily)